jgi:hypothetical protein
MPRLLAIGHVTWDRLQGQTVLGGSVTYATQTARKLGWEAAALTSAGPDFDPARDLPGVTTFLARGDATTRFVNNYGERGRPHAGPVVTAGDVVLSLVPEEWRNPDVLAAGRSGGGDPRPRGGSVRRGGRGGQRAGLGARVRAGRGSHAVRMAAAGREPRRRARAVPLRARHPGRAAPLTRSAVLRADDRGDERLRGLSLVTRDGIEQVPGLPAHRGRSDRGRRRLRGHVPHALPGDGQSPRRQPCSPAARPPAWSKASPPRRSGDRAEILRRVEARDRLVEDGEWEE